MKSPTWWCIAVGGASGPRIVTDEVGRLVVFATRRFAELFADRLRDHGFNTVPYETSANGIRDLLRWNGLDGDLVLNRVSITETQTQDPVDAIAWIHELADRVVAAHGSAWKRAQRRRR
jgi:hypothetical protein